MAIRTLITIAVMAIIWCTTYQESRMPVRAEGARRSSKPLVIAHRGLSSVAPENTLSAFEQAYQKGADFIELDVHLTKDGVPIVIHDPSLLRTTDSPDDTQVSDLTVHELQKFDAGGWFSETYIGERLPTLAQVLGKLAGRMGIFVEIKGEEGKEREIVEKVLALVKKHKTTERTPIIVGSFSLPVMRELVTQDPEQPVLGNADSLDSVRELLKLGVKHIDLDHTLVTEEVINTLRKQDVTLWCYTVDDNATARQLFDWGIDGLITNKAHQFIAAVDERNL